MDWEQYKARRGGFLPPAGSHETNPFTAQDNFAEKGEMMNINTNAQNLEQLARLERELSECREELAQCTEATDALRWHSEELEAQLAAAKARESEYRRVIEEALEKLDGVESVFDWLDVELKAALKEPHHAALEAHLREFVEHLDGFIPGLAEDCDARFDPDEDREQNWNRVAYAIQRWAWEDAEMSLDNEWQEAKMMLDKLGCEVGPMKERIDAALEQRTIFALYEARDQLKADEDTALALIEQGWSEAEVDALCSLLEAHDQAVEWARAEGVIAWSKMVVDFTKDCETTPIAVVGEMNADVGRIFLEQARHEWSEQVRAEERERCCAALCPRCAKGVPVVDIGSLWIHRSDEDDFQTCCIAGAIRNAEADS